MNDTSQYRNEINEIISIFNFCRTFNVLPGSGGLMDQDSYVMFLLEHVITAVEEKARKDAERYR